MQEDKYPGFRLDDQGILLFLSRLCVPEDSELRKQILTEAHGTPYALHPRSTKMYQDLKQNFWWNGMKKDVAKYVQSCLTSQQVKVDHQRPSGELQPIQIPEWKQDDITMDFIMCLPKTSMDTMRSW